MIAALAVMALLVSPLQAAADAPPQPRNWIDGRLQWSRSPMPEMPRGEDGTFEAHVVCTVADRGRVSDCRVLRVGPEGTRFGRNVQQALRQGRLAEGRAAPGDTYTFRIWACNPSPREGPCRPLGLPFPESVEGPAQVRVGRAP